MTNKKIEVVDFSEQFAKDYKTFGLYVNAQRSIPNVLDGLKPSQRRLIYALSINNSFSNGKYTSSAKIVGDALGKFHPHNITALYSAGVRLTKNWLLPAPLIEGKGNFGNISGSPAASYRYTEMRLSPVGDLMLKQLSPKIVNFIPTYDGETVEPETLPVPFPNLLINGTDGIGVGLTSKIPPHNPNKVIESFIYYIKKPNSKIETLVDILGGPDFPTNGYILNKDLYSFYKTGKGSFYLRGKIVKEKNKLIITEVPFTLSDKVKDFSNKISEGIKDGKIKLAKNCQNYTNKLGIRIEIEVKQGESLDELEKEIFVKTKLQDVFHAIFIALVNGKPQIITLREYYDEFLQYRRDVVKKEAILQKHKNNLILEEKSGFVKALEVLPVIIELVQNAKKTNDMMKTLMNGDVQPKVFSSKKNEKIASNFNFTELQAKMILSTPLRSINKLNKLEVEKDILKLQKELIKIQKVIDSEKEQDKHIIKELTEINKTLFNIDRNTTILKEEEITYIEEEKIIPSEISIDKFGYVKKLNIGSKEVDNEIYRGVLNSNNSISFFTTKGNYITLKIKDLKLQTLREQGDSLAKLGNLELDEYPLLEKNNGNFIIDTLSDDTNIVQITNSGYIRKIKLKELISNRKKINYYPLSKKEEVVYSCIENSDELTVITKKNKNIKITNCGTAISETIYPRLQAKIAAVKKSRIDFVINKL